MNASEGSGGNDAKRARLDVELPDPWTPARLADVLTHGVGTQGTAVEAKTDTTATGPAYPSEIAGY